MPLNAAKSTKRANSLPSGFDGAQRAGELVRRLLAFARQQPLSPKPLDANALVGNMSEILRRTLGTHIQLETVLAGGLWNIHADQSQLESALINLATNARDAMPDGGKLTIETSNAHLDDRYAANHIDVPPGQYVLIAVTDTGVGMTPEQIGKAFEPFFTTKGAGRGTGLGLAQVYGFTKQSGGHARIYSEGGHGTTVKLYLPRYAGALPHHEERRTETTSLGTARDTVLLVEDEARVRELTAEGLRELGYTVLQADSAEAALKILDADQNVTLLFTDVVMPNMDGRKLADEAVRRRPGLKVLFTTGFTKNAIIHSGRIDPNTHFIAKPFTLGTLPAKCARHSDDKTDPISQSVGRSAFGAKSSIFALWERSTCSVSVALAISSVASGPLRPVSSAIRRSVSAMRRGQIGEGVRDAYHREHTVRRSFGFALRQSNAAVERQYRSDRRNG